MRHARAPPPSQRQFTPWTFASLTPAAPRWVGMDGGGVWRERAPSGTVVGACVRACVRAARSLWLENQRRRWCCSAHTISLLLSIKLPLRSKCVISLTRGSRNGLVRDRRGRLCFRDTRERLNGLKSIPWLVCWKHEIFQ